LDGRVGNADMYDPFHPSISCRRDQRSSVLNGSLEGRLSAREPHPVGIDQSGCAAKCLSEPVGIIKAVGKDLDFLAERILTLRVVRQSAESISTAEHKPRGIFARVAERSGDDN